MESQLPYNNMNTFPAESEQPPAAPTVIVASTSSQTRYKSYGSRLNVTLGIIQIVCGVLLMGLNVSKFKTILSMDDSELNKQRHLNFLCISEYAISRIDVFISDCTDGTGFSFGQRFRWNMVWSYCKFYHKYRIKIIGTLI